MSLQRPALDELLSLLRKNDTVLVARFCHLGRRDHVIRLANSFCQRGSYFNAQAFIDIITSAGKFMPSIFASLAKYARKSIL